MRLLLVGEGKAINDFHEKLKSAYRFNVGVMEVYIHAERKRAFSTYVELSNGMIVGAIDNNLSKLGAPMTGKFDGVIFFDANASEVANTKEKYGDVVYCTWQNECVDNLLNDLAKKVYGEVYYNEQKNKRVSQCSTGFFSSKNKYDTRLDKRLSFSRIV